MDQDLAFREYRIGFKGVAWLAGASVAVYALVAVTGVAGVVVIAGMTIGYLVARTTKF
jgi:hypothetical protein